MGRLRTWDGHGVGSVGGDRVHVQIHVQIHIRKGILASGRSGKFIVIEGVDWGLAERDVKVWIEGVVGGGSGSH